MRLLLLLVTGLAMGCAPRCTTRLYQWTDYDEEGQDSRSGIDKCL